MAGMKLTVSQKSGMRPRAPGWRARGLERAIEGGATRGPARKVMALWLLVVPLALVATLSCVMRAVREIAVAALIRRVPGRPVYAIYRTPDGRWLVHADGAVRELEAEDFAQ